jgi:glycerate-2-kinase
MPSEPRTIHNFEALASSPLRRDALAIAEAAYRAIDTPSVVRDALVLDGDRLVVGGRGFSLSAFRRVSVVGFGKASCAAVSEIERILGGRLSSGIALDVRPGVCQMAKVFAGSHPRPSAANVAATERIVELSAGAGEEDLVIVAVSGGGSALLCSSAAECDQGGRLYDDLKRVGATIREMNTVRKHISTVKGGGLAKSLYPATVISLVFCDVPGGMYEEVASGPTYLDRSTVVDAQAVLDRYGLAGYALVETPKEPYLFERVHNFPVVSSERAVLAMARAAEGLGYRALDAGAAHYLDAADFGAHLLAQRGHRTAVVAAGEPSLKVTKAGGKGGRCQFTALSVLDRIVDGDVFAAFSSDGVDNSDAAGAVVDEGVLARARAAGLSVRRALDDFDPYSLLEATGDLIETGPLESNVSDLFVLLSR